MLSYSTIGNCFKVRDFDVATVTEEAPLSMTAPTNRPLP